MLANLLKDSIAYTASSILVRGLSLFLVPLYAHVLSPSEFGAFDLLIAFSALIHLSIALEIAQGMARYYGQNISDGERRSYAAGAFWFTLAAYTLFFSVAQFFAPQLAALIMGKAEYDSVFRLGALNIWVGGIFNLLQAQFRWGLQSRHYAIAATIVGIGSAVMSVLLTCVLTYGIQGLILGLLCGNLLGLVYCLSKLGPNLLYRFQISHLRQMLVFSTPLVPSSLAVFVTLYIDRLIIQHTLTVADVGIYGIGSRMASVAGLLVFGFSSAVMPLVYANYQDAATPLQIARMFRWYVLASLIICLAIGLTADALCALLLPPAYAHAAIVATILAPAILISNMYIFAPGTALRYKTGSILLANAVGAVLNTILCIALVSTFGIPGACLATLLSFIAVFSIYVAFGQQLYPIPYEWRRLLLPTAATGLALLLTHSFSFGAAGDFLWRALLISCVCGVMWRSNLLSAEDIDGLKHMITRATHRLTGNQ